MRRRDLLRSSVFAGLATMAAPAINLGTCRLYANGPTYPTRIIDLVNSSLVVDMLGLLTLDWKLLSRWHSDPAAFNDYDFARLKATGVTIFHPAVEPNEANPAKAASDLFQRWNAFIAEHPDKFNLITTPADLAQTKAAGKVGIVLGLQNSDHFQNLADVERFYQLHQRISQLTYNGPNSIGSGCTINPDTGLTAFGASVVSAMNRAGMAIDVSHSSDRTCLDAMHTSTVPVLITHSNCRALVPHPRCKSDNVIRAMARTGGVMGLTTLAAFVSGRPHAGLSDLLSHFDHVARLVGVEHVAPQAWRGAVIPTRIFGSFLV